MGRQSFVFLFRQGTEQPHQGDVNNTVPFLIHPKRYAIRTSVPVARFFLFYYAACGGERLFCHRVGVQWSEAQSGTPVGWFYPWHLVVVGYVREEEIVALING